MKNKIDLIFSDLKNEVITEKQAHQQVLDLFAVSGQLPIDNDKAWSTHDVIAKLIEATDILLHRKDYDGHGWEEIEICYQRGIEILQQIKR